MKLEIFAATGARKVGWPRLYDGAISGSPSIGDPDRDGRAEMRAVPNPSSASTKLDLRRIGGTSGARDGDDVRVYSVTGHLVRALPIPASETSDASLTWDGSNERGQRVAPGLYFARARWAGEEARLRWVRLSR